MFSLRRVEYEIFGKSSHVDESNNGKRYCCLFNSTTSGNCRNVKIIVRYLSLLIIVQRFTKRDHVHQEYIQSAIKLLLRHFRKRYAGRRN